MTAASRQSQQKGPHDPPESADYFMPEVVKKYSNKGVFALRGSMIIFLAKLFRKLHDPEHSGLYSSGLCVFG
jgi:hypothetical protein